MTMQDVKDVSLEILSDIHDFCIANNIKYSISGGTLIGAIRHKGFIPWDDDIDIVMPRQDYERFMQTYVSKKGYQKYARSLGMKDVQVMFGRICENEKTLVKTTIPWRKEDTGIWVDIFPMDGCSDDKSEVANKIERMRKLWKITFIQRSVKCKFSDCNGFSKKLKYVLKKPVLLMGDTIGRLEKQCREIQYGSTNHYINFTFLQYGIKEFHRVETFKSTILVPFENKEFYAMVGYDEILKEQYGDYMKLPPAEKQVPKHDFEKFYWR